MKKRMISEEATGMFRPLFSILRELNGPFFPADWEEKVEKLEKLMREYERARKKAGLSEYWRCSFVWGVADRMKMYVKYPPKREDEKEAERDVEERAREAHERLRGFVIDVLDECIEIDELREKGRE